MCVKITSTQFHENTALDKDNDANKFCEKTTSYVNQSHTLMDFGSTNFFKIFDNVSNRFISL